MKLTMLGTGMAMVTKCYNTCFALQDQGETFLVDGGGGNTILKRLEEAEIDYKSVHHIFITHKHIDHIMGIVWMIRRIGQGINKGEYTGNVIVYGHDEVIGILRNMVFALLQNKVTKHIDSRICLRVVEDGEETGILGCRTAFFDIHSTKDKQFGFSIYYDGEHKLTCCGDEPYNDCNSQYVESSTWLMLEAFCMYRDADIFKPYEKHHTTVKEACEQAEKLRIPNLLLYHTEDSHIAQRKALYTAEGCLYYHGNLCVPDDLESYEL